MIKGKNNWFAVLVVMEIMDVLILVLIFVVLLWTKDPILEVNAMLNNGQNLQKTSIDMIMCSKINVMKLIVGNSMIFPVLISVLMETILLNFALDLESP